MRYNFVRSTCNFSLSNAFLRINLVERNVRYKMVRPFHPELLETFQINDNNYCTFIMYNILYSIYTYLYKKKVLMSVNSDKKLM